MLKRSSVIAVFCILIGGILWSGTVFAQRGDGRSTPEGGSDSRPTLSGPGGRSQVGGTPVPGGTLPPARPTGQPPNTPSRPNLQVTVTIPFNMPNLNNINTSQLPYEFSLDNLQGQSAQSSPEAYSALVNFAAQHLGIGLTPLYAGSGNTTEVVTSEVFWQIMALFPVEMQEMFLTGTELNDVGYWGLFNNGVGIVYLSDCTDNPACTLELENTQVHLSELAMGVYGLYVPGTAPSSTDAALNMLLATYPGLTGLDFIYMGMVEEGYDFVVLDNTLSRGAAQTKLVWGGTVAYNNQTLVFVFVFVGDGGF